LTKSRSEATFFAMPKGQSSKSTKVVRTTVAAKVSHTMAVAARRPSDDDVAVRAFEIYEREGRPEGRHLAHWAQAQVELGLK
jgi:hypothetical protein